MKLQLVEKKLKEVWHTTCKWPGMYNLNNLDSEESVNRILVRVQDDKVDLVRRKTKLTALMGSSSAAIVLNADCKGKEKADGDVYG